MQPLEFGAWQPDYEPKSPGLVTASGVLAHDGKYVPFNMLIDVTSGSSAVVTGTPRNVWKHTEEDGATNRNFVGTTTQVFRESGGGFTDITNTTDYASSYAIGTNVWDFAQYKDTLYLCAGHSDGSTLPLLQYLTDISSDNELDDHDDVSTGTAPQPKSVAIYNDSLFCFNTKEGGTVYPRRLRRTKKGDLNTADSWTDDVDTGAGYEDLDAWGEVGIAIRTVGDYLVAFTSNSVFNVFKIGAPIWYQSQRIFEGDSAISIHSIARIDNNRLIFLGNNDVYMTDGVSVKALDAPIKTSILQSIGQTEKYLVTHLIDRSKKIVWWAIPTIGSIPNDILCYNWQENRFTRAPMSVFCIGNIFTSTNTIDGLNNFASTIDGLTADAIDSTLYNGGEDSLLGAIASGNGDTWTSKALNQFGGENLEGVIRTGEIDFDDNAIVTKTRPIIENPNAGVNVRLHCRNDDGDGYTTKTYSLRNDGTTDARANGRYMQVELTTLANTTNEGMRGIKLDVKRTGGRP
jgi:hypothetical protein